MLPEQQRGSLEDVVRAARAYFANELPDCRLDELQLSYFDGERLRQLILPVKTLPAIRRPVAATRHSADFRSAHWFGADYAFSALQAVVVRILWEAWESGTPDVSQERLLEESGSASSRVRDMFRGHAAWGEMIAPGESKGAFRLSEP